MRNEFGRKHTVRMCVTFVLVFCFLLLAAAEILIPEASNAKTKNIGMLMVDYSHMDQGYTW